MKSCGAIFVDRENRKSRSKTVHEIIERVQSEQPVPQISLFPEGTVTNGESLVQFKVGAFIPKVPVQPVSITFEGWNTAAWGHEGLGWYVFYTLGNFRIKLTYDYLPVVPPLESEDPISFSRRVRLIFSEHTGLSLSNLSYENVRIHAELEKLGLPFDSMDVNLGKLMKCLDYKIEDVHVRLQEFAKLRGPEKNVITSSSLDKAVNGKCDHSITYLKRKCLKTFMIKKSTKILRLAKDFTTSLNDTMVKSMLFVMSEIISSILQT
ncbi:Oidioi.mRNA.OKI2018_I69.PAR.g9139.t1.cds [Oikopleura dioica]|uniref:Oidioi.mRNA.OKI2018_I69.PAR.g9139.t1.cds n=1 Tax=Oikopleura dioica TaxID=34765 RepID=A0ABN7RJ61_OIKDI|nr:Oidioi.mRNA.OKI2018_I69.PAR.g9139.t1.cds [Oikopleura dioica]